MTDWQTSTSLSAWLAAERARAESGSHRAWIDEALRQAQTVGQLRAELQDVLASLEALARRVQAALAEDGHDA